MLINNTQIFTQEIFNICNSDFLTVGEVEITKMESTTSAVTVAILNGRWSSPKEWTNFPSKYALIA
jgi:hypothetical protein